MKNALPVFIALLISSSLRAAPTTPRFQYLSPLPGTVMVSAQTNIIVRPGEFIDRSSLDPGDLFNVTGSRSGVHAGTICLSDDERTILFLPHEPFLPDERISVIVRRGIRTVQGEEIPPTQFSFSIAPNPGSARTVQPPSDQMQMETLPTMKKQDVVSPHDWRTSSVSDGLLPPFPEILIPVSLRPPRGCLFLTSSSFDTSYKSTYLMIIDSDARPVYSRLTPAACADFKVQPNGLLTYFDNARFKFYAMDSTYAIVDSFKASNGYRTDLHDLRLLPNGHALILGYYDRPYPMNLLVRGGNANALVREVILQELDNLGRAVFEWRSWEHFEVLDAMHEDLTAAFIDYVHSNAIEVDTDGNILLSSRHLDEITKISRQTGEIMWRLGGKIMNLHLSMIP